MTDIAALIERLEKASGADRQLDWEIATKVMCMKPAEGNQPDWTLAMAYDGYAEDALRPTPYYTASIDSALSLLPETPHITALKIERDPAEYGKQWHVVYRHRHFGHASTPAIAICIACLRARSAI